VVSARSFARPAAALLDRDGTLIVDVPYNGEPSRVQPISGVRPALERLRRAQVQTAVISNQSGVARGLITLEEVEAVNRRVEELLGPVGPWFVCPHGPADGCLCRKPAPGLILEAAEALGFPPMRCVVIGDRASDVAAALAVGARAILVPTALTPRDEVRRAPEVASNLATAVSLLVGDH
jgi:D-glycero-D-manno-heptose 1,7-bisphosphate phosphatase